MDKKEIKEINEEVERKKVTIETKDIVERILDEIGIRVNVKGYRLWVTAVQIKLKNEDETMGNLYIDVAAKHKTTASKAERALRYAYEDINEQCMKYFNIQYKTNNTVFLEYLCKKTIKILQNRGLSVKQQKLSNEGGN